MIENEGLRNEVTVSETDEVNFLVVPEETSVSNLEETGKGLNGVLIGAAIATTGVVAYKYAPKVISKVKGLFKKDSNEDLEERQRKLLEQLAEVNEKIALTKDDETN